MPKSVNELVETVTRLVCEVHPDQIFYLASRIKGLTPETAMAVAVEALPSAGAQRIFAKIIDLSTIAGVEPLELSGILKGASFAYHRAKEEQSVELLWTGPSSDLVATRKTEQALIEVISSARRDLFLVSFVVFKAEKIMESLRKATDSGVEVSILLERAEQQGGQVSIDPLERLQEFVPDARIFHWENEHAEFIGGKVHAKVAVADKEVCFISSANLTDHAMGKNMEAGVLIKGGEVPLDLGKHLDALITIGVIREITPRSK